VVRYFPGATISSLKGESMEFSCTARIAIESRKKTIVEEINKLKKKIDKFDIEKPELSMISINMSIENINRLSIAISTIESMDCIQTEFSKNPIYRYATVDAN
jgi:hypothetical protein